MIIDKKQHKSYFPDYHIILISNISHFQYHFHPLPHFLLLLLKIKRSHHCILLCFASFEMFSAIFIPMQFKFTFQPSLTKLFLDNNNNHTLYSFQQEVKAVVQLHNEEHISVILSHETHAHTLLDICPLSLNLHTLTANPKLPRKMLSLSNQNVKTQKIIRFTHPQPSRRKLPSSTDISIYIIIPIDLYFYTVATSHPAQSNVHMIGLAWKLPHS